MSLWQILLFLLALSAIELALSEANCCYGFGFALLCGVFVKIHPAFLLLPFYLLALQYFYVGVKEFLLLRLTAEARMRQGYIHLRRQITREILSSRVTIL